MTEIDASINSLLNHFKSTNQFFRDASLVQSQYLSGGAINRNDKLQLKLKDGSLKNLVMRRGRGAQVPGTLSREQEFRLVQLMYDAGVPVPRPIAMVKHDQTNASFFDWCEGTTDARQMLKIFSSLPDGFLADLAGQLGRVLGKIHSDEVSLALQKEGQPPIGPCPLDGLSASIRSLRDGFEKVNYPASYLEFAVGRVCEEASTVTTARGAVLCHNDFRLGNLMLIAPSVQDLGDPSGALNQRERYPHWPIKAVLDWEFAGWGDPMSDLGWLTAPAWRFGGAHPVAGFLPLEPFLSGYHLTNPTFHGSWVNELSYWQRFAQVRWAVIASQQGERALSSDEETLELMITGLMTASILKPVVEHYLGREIGPHGVLPSAVAPQLKLDADGTRHLPEADTLLKEAWRLLRQQVDQNGQVTGKLKYEILMAANALRLAMGAQKHLSDDKTCRKMGGQDTSQYERELARDLAIWTFTLRDN
jgi:aminoglycoside phosphotransferase (APT) family kinase protein